MNLEAINKLNMKYFVVCAILVFAFDPCKGQSSQISSKLDFGTSELTTKESDSALSSSVVKALVTLQTSNSQKSLISSKLDENPFNLRSIALQSPTKPDFTSLGVICVDGRCNTTDKNSQGGEKLSTEILVEVKTNLDNKKENKTATTVGENDDVPIVVGYGGTNFKPNGLKPAIRRVDGTQDITITTGTDNSNKFGYNFGKHNDVLPKSHHNQFQHQVPYFEPSLNNHYFGESPPPQFVWYRRRNGIGQNPQSFNSRPYKPYQWQLKYPTNVPNTQNSWSQTTTCSCTNPGLNWYPNFGPHQPTPPAPINDKMNPLTK